MLTLVDALVSSGALQTDKLAEFARFSLVPSPEGELVASPEEAKRRIEEVLTIRSDRQGKETELDASTSFARTVRLLPVYLDETPVELYVGRSGNGDYLIPCVGIEDLSQFVDGLKDIRLEDEGKTVGFSGVSLLSYGGTDAFLACTPVGGDNVRDNPEGPCRPS